MAAVLGFFIAFAIAITGVGAGTITAPVLMLFMGIEPAVAVGTALLFALAVKIPAGIS
ncbi:MAG: sulfite exporter TauE/SafE family protein, partial [Nitrospinae bacterium]|nr:sulfite exporter TauE/SafE family protein [Nitrospinota bacterium]